MYRLRILVVLILVTMLVTIITPFVMVTQSLASNDFFNQRYRGWIWFEDLEKENIQDRDQIQTDIPTPEAAKEAIATRKQALDSARNVMMEAAYRPGVNKGDFLKVVEEYRRLEQEMQIMALRVGLAWDETNLLNPNFLDELNFPSNMYGRKKKQEMDTARNTEILKELASRVELFVFRRDDCGYCHDLEKHLARFAKLYDFKVEAVSADLSNSPYFKTTHSAELIQALGLEIVPTVFLVADGDNHRYEIARGLVSIETLERNTLQAASLLQYGISKLNIENKEAR